MSFFAELRRRNVIRVAMAYVVLSWVVLQIGDVLFQFLEVPGWAGKLLVALLALGFVPVLLFSWAYELTPGGLRKEAKITAGESITRSTGRRLDYLTMGMVLLGLMLVGVDRYLPRPETSRQPGAPAPGARLSDATAANSIAVLPFVDMSAAQDQAYFGDGLAEEILNLLAGIKGLKVTGRTSSFAFKGKDTGLAEIGRTLGVAHLLEGSVRKSGDRLRITAQLVKASDGFHLWSETYDRQLQDIFVIQDDIAGAIAAALELTLVASANGSVASPRAYDWYLQARKLITGRTTAGLHQARVLIDQTLLLNPDYAPALTASAELWLLLSDSSSSYGDIPGNRAIAEARTLLNKALILDPGLADAHAAMGLLFMYLHDYDTARAHLDRALAINPSLTNANHWRALSLSNSGRARESVIAARRFAELDPLFLTNLLNLGFYEISAGERQAARQMAQRLQRSYPESDEGFVLAAFVDLFQGRLASASRSIERAMDLGGRSLGKLVSELIYFALGDYSSALRRSMGSVEAEALIAQGQTRQGLDRVRARLAASPENNDAIRGRLWGLSLAGRHGELLDWVAQRWSDPGALDAQIPYDSSNGGTLLALAAAQRATGRLDELATTLEVWGRILRFLHQHGADNSFFHYYQAAWHALSGHRAAALAGLARAIDEGYRDPLLGRRPDFQPWLNDADFKAQVNRMIVLINTERADLGMEPLQ